MATDAFGNAYTVGTVGDPALFDGDTSASHFADAFIAKYDTDGLIQWVRTGGDDLVDQANDVAVDAEGNAYVTGFFTTNGPNPTVSFGPISFPGNGSSDLFLAKYNAAGELLWIRTGGGPLAEEGRGVALTPNGLIVVSGYFQGTAEFSGLTMVSQGQSDALVLAYDAAGDLVWAVSDGGTGDDKANKIAALANGDLAIVGSFQGVASIAGGSLTSAGLSNLFLARYDGTGAGIWSRSAGSALSFAGDEAYQVAEAPNGDLLLCGDIAGIAAFGGLTVVPQGGRDIFIARYNAVGDVLWVHHAGGPQADHGYGLAVDADGNSYLTGQADDGAATVFDTITLAPFGNESVFLAKYNSEGAIQWVRRYAPGLGRAIALTTEGCLYFTGGASGIVGQPAFDDVPWQYDDRAIFTARFCADLELQIAAPVASSRVHLFPNPATEMIMISGLPSDVILCRIVDATGRTLHQDRPTPSVDVERWPAGRYTLLLLQEQGWRAWGSFIVER